MKYVVVGGGIAGVSCANEILRLDKSPESEVILISASSFVKSVENYRKVGQYGEKFDVKETEHSKLFPDHRFRFVNDVVTSWNAQNKEVHLQKTGTAQFEKLCIATGSRPRGQQELAADQRFLFLRDTQSAMELRKQLESKRNVLIVGNGGIATELMYELTDVNVTWLVREEWICASFFPQDMEGFIEQRLLAGRPDGYKHGGVLKHRRHTNSSSRENIGIVPFGPALGPDWCASIEFGKGRNERTVRILRNCQIEKCRTDGDLVVEYTDKSDGKKELKPDIVIWAVGVRPNSEEWAVGKGLKVSEKGGIEVNDAFETSISDVFACGDVCSLSSSSPIWTQRQLWTQARQEGEVCGRSMASGAEEARMQSMYFELFSHCTTFFGTKGGILWG
ncbi:unnamed protein product [Caenorhabditis sp. 36 PRJEB53466]|nr:unnamed protein product [Caenorhabditis sp. 36 PRJEB53466]